jgi:hypothetical protein
VNAIAIDRRATAYLNFHDGSIVAMTTTPPLQCRPTGFLPGQGGFTNDLGMAFVVDSAGSMSETLYVSDNGGPGGNCSSATPGPACMGRGLGSIELGTWHLSPIGAFTGAAAGYNAELAGTGDARLYGFFTTTPSSYGPIDKTSGHTDAPSPTVIPPVVVGTGGYAFSFWGGDFYFFEAPMLNTVPLQLDVMTGTITTGNLLQYVIVAAGVSTCAPTHR